MKVGYWIGAVLLLEGVALSSASPGKYINTQCQANSDCGLNNHLQCINNYCQCDSHTQIYDQSTHKCLLLIGQECQAQVYTASSDGQYHPDPAAPVPQKCVPHADCIKNVCRCKPGYRGSLDFLCKPDFGSPCHAKDDCDENLGLVCTQATCQCFNTSWTYQGQFGCVDPKDPTYNEMLRLLNQTQYLLKENNLDIRDMFNELGLQNDPNSEFLFGNAIADERQFRDTYNTQDLQFAAQNNAPQSTGGNGFNFGQVLQLFQTLQSFIPRNNNNNNGGGGGGGGGFAFFRNLFGGGNNNQGGYPEATSPPPPPTYGAPGGAMMGQRMGLINSFLNLFNQLIPVVRQLRMRFSPVRFIQNLLNRFAPQTTAAPPAAAIINPPPTVIESNGNYQSNPIFSNSNSGSGNNQGAGSTRFFMRTRDRFRNLLRGNSQGGYPAAMKPGYSYAPPSKYAPPGGGEEAPPPAEDDAAAAAPPPADGAGEAPAGSSNFFTNNPAPSSVQSRPGSFRVQQQEFNTITITQSGRNAASSTSSSISSHGASQRHERQPSNYNGLPSPSTHHNSGQNLNHQSFFNGNNNNVQQQHHQQPSQYHIQQANRHIPQSAPAPASQQQLYNNQIHHSNANNFNNHATSHRQETTYVPQRPQTPSEPDELPTSFQRPPSPNEPPSIYNQDSFTASGAASTPHSIPKFTLPAPSQKTITSASALSQNYILSEADDPHPGFTQFPSDSDTAAVQQQPAYQPHHHQHQQQQQIHHQPSYRTSARFERIGEEDSDHDSSDQPSSAVENWKESF